MVIPIWKLIKTHLLSVFEGQSSRLYLHCRPVTA